MSGAMQAMQGKAHDTSAVAETTATAAPQPLLDLRGVTREFPAGDQVLAVLKEL